MSFTRQIGSGASPINFAPNSAAAAEQWTRVLAETSVERLSASGLIADPTLEITMEPPGIYLIRGIFFFTAEAGGPSLQIQMTGPALTAMNLRRGIANGAQTNVALAPGYTARMAYDAAFISMGMNTGAPARALATYELEGMIQPSAAGTLQFLWTSSNAIWSLTRRAGSYLEYKIIT